MAVAAAVSAYHSHKDVCVPTYVVTAKGIPKTRLELLLITRKTILGENGEG